MQPGAQLPIRPGQPMRDIEGGGMISHAQLIMALDEWEKRASERPDACAAELDAIEDELLMLAEPGMRPSIGEIQALYLRKLALSSLEQ